MQSNSSKENILHPNDTARCWSNHLGLWCIEALWFTQAVGMFRAGMWAFQLQSAPTPLLMEAAERRPYQMTEQGTALFPLFGPLTKAGSVKFDGTSTVRAQRALRLAATDETVRNGVLHIHSPGGHVEGIDALAREISRFRAQKRLVAQIEDLGASAAYWAASQADEIYASPASEVGSLGTMAMVEDTSGRMDRLGIKVHVISTGPYKGMGAEGAPVSEATLAYIQERVDAMNRHFMRAVQQGRRLTDEQLGQVFTGKVWSEEEAQQLRLIDRVQSLDETMAQLSIHSGTLAPARPRATRTAARLDAWQAQHSTGGDHARHI